VEVLVRELLPHLKKQLPEGCTVIDNSPLQRPITQAEIARDGRYLWAAPREQSIESPFHLLNDRSLRTAL
jgi:hypothetical protein